MTLSVCLIVNNEEDVIARVLTCAKKFADEIVVCDCGSIDNTLELAKEYTDKIYCFSWCDDFSCARNFSFSKATCDYIMWLDADDFITDENCEKFKLLKNNLGNYDAVFAPYVASFYADGRPQLIYFRERIVRAKANFKWQGAVHEVISINGKIHYCDASVYHKKQKSGDKLRNLRIYQGIISSGKILNAREKYYYGKELYYNGMFLEAHAVLLDAINSNSWVENKIDALRTLYKIALRYGENNAINYILQILTCALPRSEDCCILGDYFLAKGELDCAIYWYQCALKSSDETQSGAFVNKIYADFYPYIQLCVAYDKLGDYAKAEDFNRLAGAICPNDCNYLANVKYFKERNK